MSNANQKLTSVGDFWVGLGILDIVGLLVLNAVERFEACWSYNHGQKYMVIGEFKKSSEISESGETI